MTARVRLGDLPPALRRQVADADAAGRSRARAQATDQPSPPRTRPARLPKGCKVRCVTCGEMFDRYGIAVERHVDEHGGGRVALVLE